MNQLTGEDARLRTLHSYRALDSAAEDAFDDIARAAAKVCEASLAAVSLVDADRQWFKAEVGLGLRQTPRDISFCTHAMHRDSLFVVPDAAADPRFRENPLVSGDPGLRFYAGAAIRAPDGAPLGALCVMDRAARPEGLTPMQADMLRVLADQIEPRLRLRMKVAEREALAERRAAEALATLERENRLLTALESAEVGWWEWDIAADLLRANPDMARSLGLDLGSAMQGVPLSDVLARVHPQDRLGLQDAIKEAVRTGEPFREEYRVLDSGDRASWTSARGRCLYDEAGSPSRLAGIGVDVTARREAQEQLRDADLGRELALEAARLGRFDHDIVSGRRFYDARAQAMLGVTLEEVQDPKSVLSFVHPDDRARVAEAQAAACNPERRGPYREVYRVRHPRSGEERWISGVGRTRFENGVCTRFMGVLEDVTERRQAEEHRQLLMHELNHRVKNTLALVQALVDASLRSARDPVAARADIAGRIQALSRAHDLLTAQNWSAASVAEVVRQVAGALSLPPERIRAAGPPVQLGPKPALQLALALHELATNALKYGALSNETGAVTIGWGLAAEDGVERFFVDWRERGGPTVAPPTRRGFGSRLVERSTAMEFDGEVRLDYAPEGVCWRLEAPYAGLDRRGRKPTVIAG